MKFKAKYWWIIVVAIPVLLLFWGLLEPYFIDQEEEIATIPDLPNEWQGQKIAQISDFQLGMWGDNVPTMRRSVETLIEENPAVVLISGDFIYHAATDPENEIVRVIDILTPLAEAGIPTYAVLGNHDYGMKSKSTQPKVELANRLEAALEEIGIPVLENEAVELELANGGESLYLVGIGSHWANRDDINQALGQVPDDSPRFVMMHNPESFTAFPPETAPMAVAGHTHGGQIRLPYSPEWSWLALVKPDEVHADGWIDNYGEAGNDLYVNRGIGFSSIPIRLNCMPEITMFTLVSG